MRVSYKVTEFNKDLLVRSMFEDAKSFKYFKIGLDACIEIRPNQWCTPNILKL